MRHIHQADLILKLFHTHHPCSGIALCKLKKCYGKQIPLVAKLSLKLGHFSTVRINTKIQMKVDLGRGLILNIIRRSEPEGPRHA